MKLLHLFPGLVAALCLAVPVSGFGKDKHTYYRDLDHDGHYNKKSYDHHHGYNHGYYGYGRGYYGYPYYRHSYYGSPYYYGYGYPRASFGFSYSPSYYSSYYPYAYRGRVVGGYADDLALDVQTALKRRGYYRGPIDGDIGPGSRAAIRSYQADRGLAVTGRIDSSLLRALGIS